MAHIAETDRSVDGLLLSVIEAVKVTEDKHLRDGQEAQEEEKFDKALLKHKIIVDSCAIL